MTSGTWRKVMLAYLKESKFQIFMVVAIHISEKILLHQIKKNLICFACKFDFIRIVKEG